MKNIIKFIKLGELKTVCNTMSALRMFTVEYKSFDHHIRPYIGNFKLCNPTLHGYKLARDQVLFGPVLQHSKNVGRF